MMNAAFDLNSILGVVMALAFFVNIIVQLTKGFVPLPTKLWCMLVSFIVVMCLLFAAVSLKMVDFDTVSIILSVFSSFIISFIAMYGFDTFRELWQRFRKGENINGNN